MPSRSFFQVPDQAANALILADSAGEIGDNALKLISNSRAPLINDGSLALFLGISTEVVYSIITKKQKHYRRFIIKKGNGKFRFIDAPRTYLKVVQWWILDNILSSVQLPDYVTGFVRGRSIVSNATRHVGMRHILNMDIANFFPSINEEMVSGIFENLGYSQSVSAQLAAICTLNGVLPQGAPTSPMLANISAQNLDRALLAFSSENGLLYSRYADDLTFSSNSYINAEIAEKIARIIQASGFVENAEKRRFKGPGGRKTVTGLVVNDYVQLPREWRKKFRSLIHRVMTDPAKHSHLADELCGGIGVLRAVYRVETHPLIVAGYRALALLRERRSSQNWQGS